VLEGLTILVTGATGRLGCALVSRIESLGGKVLPLVLPGYPPGPKRVAWSARTQPIIVRDVEALAPLESPSHVINLHWRVDRTRTFEEQLAGEIRTNISDLAFLWDWIAAGSVEGFVNVSTLHVYGRRNLDEISCRVEPHPDTAYGIAKLASEHFFDARFTGRIGRVVHLRLSSVAHPDVHPTQLVSRICASALQGERIQINSGVRTHLLHLDHAIDLILQATLSSSQSHYVLAGEGALNEDIVALFERRLGRTVVADYVTRGAEIGEVRLVSDIDKLVAPFTRAYSLAELVDDICGKVETASTRL